MKVPTQVNRSTEKTIMQSLEETDPALAEEVRKQMFVFEDIIAGRPPDPESPGRLIPKICIGS